MGRKFCSESRTPGHTKHRQTLYINPTLVVADCPGLVFPAVNIPRELQVLCGIFPIAQCREPYSAIKFLAQRVPLEDVYKLEKVEKTRSSFFANFPGHPWTLVSLWYLWCLCWEEGLPHQSWRN